ncbi:MAG TPA: hypothetical protein VEO02_12740 [Thermoanaerobaculia bacterium]|nr:hypothetical protein [Thermoanaerobaculia bacterium]
MARARLEIVGVIRGDSNALLPLPAGEARGKRQMSCLLILLPLPAGEGWGEG